MPIFSVSETEKLSDACQGGNQKQLLIITTDATEKQHLDLLAAILKAVQHEIETDACLLQHPSDQPLNLTGLYQNRTIERVLVFGHSAANLGLSVQYAPYRSFLLVDKTYLFADPLAKLSEDKSLKAALWTALKKMF
ncbi:MAG: hypothetical protein AAFV95_14930 [Bacteroidota bacterium]